MASIVWFNFDFDDFFARWKGLNHSGKVKAMGRRIGPWQKGYDLTLQNDLCRGEKI